MKSVFQIHKAIKADKLLKKFDLVFDSIKLDKRSKIQIVLLLEETFSKQVAEGAIVYMKQFQIDEFAVRHIAINCIGDRSNPYKKLLEIWQNSNGFIMDHRLNIEF